MTQKLTTEDFFEKILRGETDFSEIEVKNLDLTDDPASIGCLYIPKLKYVDGKVKLNFENSTLNNLTARWIPRLIIEATNAEMKDADLDHANLSDSTFKEADLTRAGFVGTWLSGCNFNGANLQDAQFDMAYLEESTFENANLEGASLRWTNLSGSNLKKADVKGADFKGATLTGTDLTEVKNLDEAKNVGLATFSNAKVSEEVKGVITSKLEGSQNFK